MKYDYLDMFEDLSDVDDWELEGDDLADAYARIMIGLLLLLCRANCLKRDRRRLNDIVESLNWIDRQQRVFNGRASGADASYIG